MHLVDNCSPPGGDEDVKEAADDAQLASSPENEAARPEAAAQQGE